MTYLVYFYSLTIEISDMNINNLPDLHFLTIFSAVHDQKAKGFTKHVG